jgi:TolA-binding protein
LRRPLAAALLLISALNAPRASAQGRPGDLARELLEQGREQRRSGKVDLALDSFNRIVTAFADTDSVDDALLEIGRYHMDVTGDAEKARQTFEQITRAYPQSDGAPGAFYWLGRLTLSRANTAAEIDDAMAQFTRVQRLYPRSEWVGHALYASGLAQRKIGKLPEAIEYERRVVLEYGHSEAAPAAQFEIGRCYALLGDPRQAMEEFQQVRNRFSDEVWQQHALARITALWRLYGTGKPTFNVDASYALAAGEILKDVSAIHMTPDRTLWVASGKARGVVAIGPDGKPGKTLPLEDPRAISFSPRNEIVVAGRMGVLVGPTGVKAFAVPGDKPGILENLEKIAAAVVAPGGSLIVSDEKKRRMYRYDDQNRSQGPFPDGREHEVTRLGLDSEGSIVLLDEIDKSVRVFDVSGRPIRAIAARGAGYEIKKPVDVAVDAFRNTYVADGDGAIFIFGEKGALLATLTAAELRRPRAITLEPDGALLVYDEKAERILRFR